MLLVEQALGGGALRRRLAQRLAGPRSEAEQAPDHGTNGVLALAGPEVEHQPRVAGEAGRLGQRLELVDQPGLADARLAPDIDDLALAGLPAGRQHGLELRQLRAPADQEMALQPGRAALDAGQAPGAQRAVPAIHRHIVQDRHVHQSGQPGHQGVGQQRLAGSRQVLQPGGQVHRLAGYRVLPVRRAAGAAGHDLARSQADVALERRLQGRHGAVDLQRRVNGPLCVVAMGDRCAEHRHHRIADVLVDHAAVALHHGVDRAEVAVQERVNLLRVALLGQSREAAEIGEEDGDLAALAGRLRGRDLGRRLGSGRSAVAEGRDRLEQLLARAQRQAEVLEIRVAQVRQDLSIDLVLGEGPGVLAEPDPLEPRPDVFDHAPPSGGTIAAQAGSVSRLLGAAEATPAQWHDHCGVESGTLPFDLHRT